MAKKIFKRLASSAGQLKENEKLGALGSRIHDANLWHLNRHSVSRAFFAALFTSVTFMVIPGHMITAAMMAIWIRANLPIAVSLVWLVNPVTIPPLAYAALKIGTWIMPVAHKRHVTALMQFDWRSSEALGDKTVHFWHLFEKVWEPFMLGSLVLGLATGISTYLLVQLFWRIHVVRTWNARQKKRRQQNQTAA